MTQTDQWDRIRELFEEVSRHAPNERREALRNLCPNDVDLQNEVLSLIEHDEQADAQFLTPLEHPLTETEVDKPDPLIGTRLGKCLIRRVIATGGMGVVYEAEQENPQRTVAVKVMKSLAWSRMVRRRFEFEVQALARLTHPNIAQIYDADTVRNPGAADGTPYFVMEFVPDASPINEYADRHKLDRNARLELFLRACDAVQYGHQRGIIHRDLKPANMLVSASGQVKVIDFGVAKATDSDVAATTQLTDVGQLIGTLRYMSPEQCQADPLGLDVRSDVYSLGVVLYELLCGKVPYDVSSTSIAQAARAICEEPPIRPSATNRSLRGDLDIILLKSLEKDPAKRYQSVADLSRDLRHYLAREPIEARRQSLAASTYTWVLKHPTLATATGASLVGITVLLAFYLALKYYGFEPYEAVVGKEDREVTLLSAAGKIVQTWTGTEPKTYKFAKLIEEGDKRLVIIGRSNLGDPATRGKLLAYDATAKEYDIPMWTDSVTDEDMPVDIPEDEKKRGFRAIDFCPAGELKVYLADIFPANPGRELIVSYSHVLSRRLIRILSLLDGSVLWQIWHDGPVSDVLWLSRAELLILAGTNCDEEWYGQNETKPITGNYAPWVVWAVRPEFAKRHNQYICTGRFTKCLPPVWYKWVLPQKRSIETFHAIDLGPSPVQDDGSRFLVQMFYGPQPLPPSAGWILDAGGSMPDLPLYKNDVYRHDGTLPRIEDFHLGDHPKIIPDGRHSNEFKSIAP